jgi:Myb-like DNA-binding domain
MQHANPYVHTTQVRNRYTNHLSPAVSKAPWSPEEDQMLWELQASRGNKWAEISRLLPGRSDNDVKNRWHTCKRHAQRQAGVITAPHGGARTGAAFAAKKKAARKEAAAAVKAQKASAKTQAVSDDSESAAQAAGSS